MTNGKCKLQITKCKLQIVGMFLLLLVAELATAAPFTFDDIDFWVGSGANRAAVAIDWVEDSSVEPALVWGYRWDGSARGRDMLMAVVAADDRLFAKFGNTQANPVRLYGLGYDSDDDAEFGACSEFECSEFDEDGFAYSGEIFVFASATDAGDQYREGWATGTGFWHYSIPVTPGTNPYDGGQWSDIQVGMSSRQLVDGDWDSWVFQLSTTPPFDSVAENPAAALSPYPPGDFNRDTFVNALDYSLWKSKFGSTVDPAVDANGNGIVDAGDYTIWRDNLNSVHGFAAAHGGGIPEPSTLVIALSCCIVFWPCFLRRKLNQEER